jgi:nitrite reductase (NO-forming)
MRKAIRWALLPLALLALAGLSAAGCTDENRETVRATLVNPPNVPPKPDRRAAHVIVELQAQEAVQQIAPGQEYEVWAFNGTVPGPMVRVQVGDTVEVRLSNRSDSKVAHNIDFHAVNGPGGGADATNVLPGETRSFTFKAMAPGLFTYHCAQGIVADHISNGMFGGILVERPGSTKPYDREFYIGQSEFYLADSTGPAGVPQLDFDKLLAEEPTHVVFNGQTEGLRGDRAIRAETGETVRVYLSVGGPNLTSSFHVIGEIFDRVYQWGSLSNPPLSDIQTVSVPPGGAVIADFKVDVPGDYRIVDHALSRVSKGLLGILTVTGEEDFDVFRDLGKYPLDGGEEPGAAEPAPTSTEETGAGGEAPAEQINVSMEDNRFVPDSFTVQAGSRITFNLANAGLLPHNMHIATADGSYDGGAVSDPELILGGGTGTLTWTAPTARGIYNFRCDVHPVEMVGTITVE